MPNEGFKNKKRLKTPKVEREKPVPSSALRFHTGAAVPLHNRGSFLRCVRKKPSRKIESCCSVRGCGFFFFSLRKGGL